MIFKELFSKKICFAVMRTNSRLQRAQNVGFREWDIILREMDLNKIESGQFMRMECFPKVVLKELTRREVDVFHDLLKQDLFRCVINDRDGILWELYDAPLAQKLNGTRKRHDNYELACQLALKSL